MIKEIIKKQKYRIEFKPELEQEFSDKAVPFGEMDRTDDESLEVEMTKRKPDVMKKCKMCHEVFEVHRNATKCPGCGAGRLYTIEIEE